MEAADIESTGAVPVSPYEVLLSDIIRGYEYSPNLAMEFSWAADAQLRLTPAQQSLLEMYFGEQPRPSMATKGEIAEIAKISVEKVTVCFTHCHVMLLLTPQSIGSKHGEPKKGCEPVATKKQDQSIYIMH